MTLLKSNCKMVIEIFQRQQSQKKKTKLLKIFNKLIRKDKTIL